MILLVRFILLLLFSFLAGCSVNNASLKYKKDTSSETEWGYKKLPYDEWKFLFIYPKSLPALATQALMVDGAGYVTAYQYVDGTESSDVSIGRWNDRLGGTQAHYNKGKSLPVMLKFCWDSVIDKKNYETVVMFKQGTWNQMVTPYNDSRWNEIYYRSTMIIGLAPGGSVSVWLGDRGNPVVLQSDAKITTVSGDKLTICKGVTKHPNGYTYYGDTPEFVKGKTYPYGNW
ncbi:DUF2931 family protein [Pantoea sp. B9002]|uniref:DUF2931 family protein n=1 Tax=Pantoea sp. B9002 TaxID=2726979 RepID=UPI0015A3DB21|nr:DUF2931 family protein [Pantoea sp. B9002]NWA62192.1 DUF2931 family protein [Pantoea sp. B9002]